MAKDKSIRRKKMHELRRIPRFRYVRRNYSFSEEKLDSGEMTAAFTEAYRPGPRRLGEYQALPTGVEFILIGWVLSGLVGGTVTTLVTWIKHHGSKVKITAVGKDGKQYQIEADKIKDPSGYTRETLEWIENQTERIEIRSRPIPYSLPPWPKKLTREDRRE